MKMLKKVGALLLAVALLPTVSVLAQTAESYTDNLNKYETDITMPWSGYGNDTYPSDVFIKKNGNYGFIDADGGPDGTAALQMTQNTGDHVELKTRTVNVGTATNPVVTLTYDFKIVSHPATDGKNIYLGANGGGNRLMFKLALDNGTWKIVDANSTNAYAYTLDKWYSITVISTPGGMRSILTDYDTGEVIMESVHTSAGVQSTLLAVYFQRETAGNGPFCSIMLDNVKLAAYDAAAHAPELDSTSVTDGAENVPRNQKLTFTFDQELTDFSTISLKKRDENGDTDVDGAVTSKVAYNTLSVTYDGLLDKGSEYVLTFENVNNGITSSSESELTFTTENLHLWNDVVVSSAEPNEADATKTDVTFTINDEYGYPVFSGSVMAVVYQGGKMIEADMKPLSNTPTGELTESFALGTVPADAKIGIILLDVENGPIPLASGMLDN